MPKKGDQVFSPRDNTKTRFVPEVGFQPGREVRPRDVRLDDGVTGYLPVIGDILQAGQAIRDLHNKEYGKAALGAGMLLLPNVLDKPVKQVLNNGVERVLRREPGMTLHLFDADHPYRGTNFLHHGTAYSDDILGNAADGVLKGETRAMSPSFAINRIGDFNDISTTPGRYWDAFFIGDKSLLDDAIIYRGDGNTPILSDVDVNPNHLFGSIPSAAREEAAERLWKNTLSGPWKGSGPTITVPDLDVVDQPDIKYFEAKIHGTVPLDKMRHGVFLDPKYSDNPKKAEKVIQAYSDRGLPVSLYNGTRDGWAETYLDILNNNPDILFKFGGNMNKYPGGGRFFRAGETNNTVPGTLLSVSSVGSSVPPVGQVIRPLDLGAGPSVVVDQNPSVSGNPAAPMILEGIDPSGYVFDMSAVQPSLDYGDMKMRQRYAESGFRDNLTSKAGAKGRYQIMPITLQEYTNKTGKTGDLMDAAFNEGLRDWYMDEALPKYNAIKRGNPTDLVREYRKYAAYNMGPGALNKALTKAEKEGVDIDNTTDWVKYLPKETRDYVNFIVGREDIADTSKTKLLYEAAKKLRGVKEDGGLLYDYSAGGNIHIAPSKKGTFTAAASKHGKSVQEFASQVLANKENYSPAMVKKANFARNAAKWHAGGGLIDRYGADKVLTALLKIREKHTYDGRTEDTQQVDTVKMPFKHRLYGVGKKAQELSNGRITKDNIGVLYNHPQDWAKRMYSEDELDMMRQNLYNGFLPTRYDYEKLKTAASVAQGGPSDIPVDYDEAVRLDYADFNGMSYPSIRDEAFALYLQPKVERPRFVSYFEPTLLRPASGSTYDRVYSFNRKSNPFFEQNLVESYNNAMSGGRGIHTADPEGKIGGSYRIFIPGKTIGFFNVDSRRNLFKEGMGDPSDAPTGTWTLSSGVDPYKGQYISFYDDYDLNPSVGGRSAGKRSGAKFFPIKTADFTGGLGHPFSIYDRVYLDDYYGVSSAPEGGSYYGGYLVPAVVSPSPSGSAENKRARKSGAKRKEKM